jgi:hypothetical protein
MTPPAAAAAPSAPAAPRRAGTRPAPRVAPARPRRISGPARPPARRSAPPAARTVPSAQGGLAVGVLNAAESLSRHRALDRLIRGRVWIALIAFSLIGIVTLQLLVLQLNASIGRALERQGLLQRENAALSIEGSELASGERVEAQAAHLGMTLVPIGALRFLTVDPRVDVKRAATALDAPARGSSSPASAQPLSTSSAGEAAPEQAASASTAGAPAVESPASATGEGAAAASAEAGTGTPAASSTQTLAPASTPTVPSTPTAPSAPTSATGASGASGETAPTSSAGGVGTAGGMGANQSLGPG